MFSENKTMKIAITGSNGFVGKNLAKYLQNQEFDLHFLQLRNSFVTECILEQEIIIHLAGKAHALKKANNLETYYEINTELTKKVFDAFLASRAKVFITLSSVKAVRDFVGEDILTEEIVPDPGTYYGKSKLLAEQYIFSKPIPVDKRIYILRPCMIHGPGNKGNLNLLYKVAKLGIPFPLAAFENRRSFVSIENLCFVIKELIERDDIPSGIYNVADDTPLSTNRVIQIISETISKKARLWKINKFVIKVIARIGDFIPFPLNSERLQKLTESYAVSNEKLKLAVNKPLPLSSEEGLRRTIQSFMHV